MMAARALHALGLQHRTGENTMTTEDITNAGSIEDYRCTPNLIYLVGMFDLMHRIARWDLALDSIRIVSDGHDRRIPSPSKTRKELVSSSMAMQTLDTLVRMGSYSIRR